MTESQAPAAFVLAQNSELFADWYRKVEDQYETEDINVCLNVSDIRHNLVRAELTPEAELVLIGYVPTALFNVWHGELAHKAKKAGIELPKLTIERKM